MTEILIGIAVPLVIGLISFGAKQLYSVCKERNRIKRKKQEIHEREHEEIRDLIKSLKPLVEEQTRINQQLRESDVRLKETDGRLKENAMLHTRETIVKYYYKGKENGGLEQYQYMMVNELYESYKKLGGNSYVKKLVEEIENGTYNL